MLGPHELDLYETSLRLFDGVGLTGLEMTRMAAVVHIFTRGAAQAVVDARAAERATGQSDDDWWNARAPLLEEMVDDAWEARYPVATRLSSEHAFDQPDRPPADATPYLTREALDAFEFGLQRTLDGLEAFITARAAGLDTRPP